MKRILSLTFGVMLLAPLAAPESAYACSCISYEDKNERNTAYYNNANLVIQGVPIEMEDDGEIIRYAIAVEKVWKGKVDAHVDIYTARDSAACAVTLTINEPTLIYAYEYETLYQTGLCSGTTKANPENAEWLNRHIRAISQPEKPDYFSDVSESHSNNKAIMFVKNEGIVEGYEDGSYRPDRAINRAEFTKIIISANFTQEETETCDASNLFTDVAKSDWFANAVCTAKQNEVIGGYPDGSFGPAHFINFAEAAKIVVEAFDIPLGDTAESPLIAIATPQDIRLATDVVWWKPYVFALSRIGGLPTSFSDPNQELSRADLAEIIYRVMMGMEK